MIFPLMLTEANVTIVFATISDWGGLIPWLTAY